MSIITNKPWGSEELIHQGSGYAVKIITLNKTHQTSMHYHEIKHETIVVHSGSLNIYIDDRTNPARTLVLNTGESLAIPPKVIHQMSASQTDAVYFEAQTDHLSDVIRLADDYGRA